MKVKIQYFGVAREFAGQSEETLEVKDRINLSEILASIVQSHDKRLRTYLMDPSTSTLRAHPAVRFIVDGRIIPSSDFPDTTLKDGSRISIVPTQGG